MSDQMPGLQGQPVLAGWPVKQKFLGLDSWQYCFTVKIMLKHTQKGEKKEEDLLKKGTLVSLPIVLWLYNMLFSV